MPFRQISFQPGAYYWNCPVFSWSWCRPAINGSWQMIDLKFTKGKPFKVRVHWLTWRASKERNGRISLAVEKRLILHDWMKTSPQGGLAAAFDLAAYDGYMIARVKKSVNHSRIIQSMRETSISFLFRRHIGFSDSREDRKCVQSCNLTSIYFPLFVVLWKWPLSADVHDLKSLVRSISMWKSFEELRQAVTDFSFQVFVSALHFGKCGLQPRV